MSMSILEIADELDEACAASASSPTNNGTSLNAAAPCFVPRIHAGAAAAPVPHTAPPAPPPLPPWSTGYPVELAHSLANGAYGTYGGAYPMGRTSPPQEYPLWDRSLPWPTPTNHFGR